MLFNRHNPQLKHIVIKAIRCTLLSICGLQKKHIASPVRLCTTVK